MPSDAWAVYGAVSLPYANVTAEKFRPLCRMYPDMPPELAAGIGFGNSMGFTLPDGAILAPPLSWVRRESWEALSRGQPAGLLTRPDGVLLVRQWLTLCLLCLLFAVRAGAQAVTVTIDRTRPLGVSHFETGVTHTQYSMDAWGDQASIARAEKLLKACCTLQNQHIMGWGAGNPEPSPGVYQWESLDKRVALMRAMKAVSVITLCGAPDWMKGGAAGKTDWSRLEAAPLPAHYADFAELARQVARRYPDVLHFQVWNEMKGLWSAQNNNWDYKAYTDLYNVVYDALKSVNPQIQVGGPYLVIEGTGTGKGDWSTQSPITPRQWDVLNYWLAHKHGADFITLDKGLIDYHDLAPYSAAETMALTHTFGDVVRQIRAKTSLPVWWAEFYGAGIGAPDDQFLAAQYASILKGMIEAGASVALLWSPQKSDVAHALFTDTRTPGGGQSLPLFAVYKTVHDDFRPGAKLYRSMSSSPDVEALASDRCTLLINKRPAPVTVRLEGKAVTLARYEVRRVAREGR